MDGICQDGLLVQYGLHQQEHVMEVGGLKLLVPTFVWRRLRGYITQWLVNVSEFIESNQSIREPGSPHRPFGSILLAGGPIFRQEIILTVDLKEALLGTGSLIPKDWPTVHVPKMEETEALLQLLNAMNNGIGKINEEHCFENLYSFMHLIEACCSWGSLFSAPIPRIKCPR